MEEEKSENVWEGVRKAIMLLWVKIGEKRLFRYMIIQLNILILILFDNLFILKE
jgi:hypothetical protein